MLWLPAAVVASLVSLAAVVAAEMRTWTDSSGKHQIEAELLSVEDGKALLRRADGKEISVALDQLSVEDRAYVRKQTAPSPKPRSAGVPAKPRSAGNVDPEKSAVLEIAEKFYGDLKTKERTEARGLLTAAAQELATDGTSPLESLPTPDDHAKAIRTGKVRVDGDEAEVPVQVRVNGEFQKTTLHLRKDADQWRVIALSAKAGETENKVDFETPVAKPQPAEDQPDPLAELVGKELPLAGFLLDGTPLDMSRFAGKVVLVDFWATWCGPCLAEMPNVLANYQRYRESGFEVIAISLDEDLGELRKFVAQQGPPWTVVADNHPLNQNKMGARYNIRGIPAFILLGKDGKVADVNCRGERLGQQLAQLLGGPAAGQK